MHSRSLKCMTIVHIVLVSVQVQVCFRIYIEVQHVKVEHFDCYLDSCLQVLWYCVRVICLYDRERCHTIESVHRRETEETLRLGHEECMPVIWQENCDSWVSGRWLASVVEWLESESYKGGKEEILQSGRWGLSLSLHCTVQRETKTPWCGC